MTKPLLSVVIPAYNYASVLPRAVESVIQQLTDEVELLVIDDGSPDDTASVLEQLHARYPQRFRSIRQANAGPASARNHGIRESQGEYLLFLDADDELLDGALALWLAEIRQYPGSRLFVAGDVSVRSDGRERFDPPTPIPDSLLARVRGYLLDKTVALSNGATVFHRSTFDKGLYPEHFRNAEDIPVFCQALVAGECRVINQPVVRIHKHDDSLRHHSGHGLQVGLQLVDEVFNRLPASVQGLKSQFAAQRCLSLFRTQSAAGNHAQAWAFYKQALGFNWKVIFRWSYTRKALRLCLK